MSNIVFATLTTSPLAFTLRAGGRASRPCLIGNPCAGFPSPLDICFLRRTRQVCCVTNHVFALCRAGCILFAFTRVASLLQSPERGEPHRLLPLQYCKDAIDSSSNYQNLISWGSCNATRQQLLSIVQLFSVSHIFACGFDTPLPVLLLAALRSLSLHNAIARLCAALRVVIGEKQLFPAFGRVVFRIAEREFY